MDANPSVSVWTSLLPANLAALLAPERASAQIPAAQGLLPCATQDLVVLLCALCVLGGPDVQQMAQATLRSMPAELVCKQVAGLRQPQVLEVLSTVFALEYQVLEALVLNPMTPDATLVQLATQLPQNLAQLLVDNHARCLRSQELVRALVKNSNLEAHRLESLFDFLVRNDVQLMDLPQYAEAYTRLTTADRMTLAAHTALPDTLQSLLSPDPEGVEEHDAGGNVPEHVPDLATPGSASSSTLSPQETEKAAETEKKLPVLKLINSMNMAQKVALATRGNKEARSILLRDANRVVALAAIKNPRISEQEIQAAARSRSVHDDVIRIIANSKEMTRGYATKLALVQNPKTPVAIALRMLPAMRAVDLKAISKSKGLPQVLVAQAQKILRSKDGGG